MSPAYLVKVRCSKLLHNIEMYYLQQTIWRQDTVNWNMVYLAELLVVMTDRLKIVRICAWNVHRVHGHKRLDDDACLTSLSQSRQAAVLCFDVPRGAVLLKHTKIPGTTCACLAIASMQESCRDIMLFHFDIKSEQYDCEVKMHRTSAFNKVV